MPEPTIFILGVQKCGTTTIADLLAEQPEIFVPSIKETYFFCDESLYVRGFNWYLQEFYPERMKRGVQHCVDATPFYLASKEASERIATHTSDSARFIVCLRNPVDRAYSAYWHQRRLGNENLEFEQALDAEPERIARARAERGRWWRHAYVEVGRYGTHLERAYALFGHERIHVLYEDDLRDIPALQARLRKWLGLPPRAETPKVHRSNNAAMPVSRSLQALVTRPNAIKALVRRALPRELRSAWGRRLLRLNQRAFRYPPMHVETRRRLQSLYNEEFARLESLGMSVPVGWRSGAL